MQGAQVPIQIWIWHILRFSDSIVTCPQQLHREKTSRGASSYQKREVIRISAGSVCNRHYSYVISLSLSLSHTQSLSERVAFSSTGLFVKRAQFLRSKTIKRLKGNRCGRQASKLQTTKLQAMSHLHKQVPACCISRILSLSRSFSQTSSDREASSSSTGLFLRSKTIIMPPKGNRCVSRQAGRLQNKHLLKIHKLAAQN